LHLENLRDAFFHSLSEKSDAALFLFFGESHRRSTQFFEQRGALPLNLVDVPFQGGNRVLFHPGDLGPGIFGVAHRTKRVHEDIDAALDALIKRLDFVAEQVDSILPCFKRRVDLELRRIKGGTWNPEASRRG
jgi:hypothetical protein